jgi:hypothetical protein
MIHPASSWANPVRRLVLLNKARRIAGGYISVVHDLRPGLRRTSLGLEPKALLEASLRLAWYIDNHGSIPDKEIGKLVTAGYGLHRSAETERLLVRARDAVAIGIQDFIKPIARLAGPSQGDRGFGCNGFETVGEIFIHDRTTAAVRRHEPSYMAA